MKPSIWRRVDIQVSLFTAIVVALLTFSIFWFQYRITYNDTLISLRDQAEAIYGYVEKRLDKSTFDLVRTREDMEGDVYKQAHEAFQRIREISGVRYLYTAKMNEDGEFVYLIDCLDQSEPDFRYPGDLIEHEIYPDMQRALDGQKVLPDRIKDTEWGKIFITYMPIYDGEQVLGVVGIEFEAGHQYDTYRSLRLLLPLFILLFSLGACLASRLLFRRISNPFYRDMSNTDYLTQLKNRNAYQLDIGNRIAGKAQEGTGFMLLDLNGLKHVNDTLGHDAGDVYITCVSKAYLNMRTREAVMYRIGGDEFVVVMPDADRDKIQDFMRRFGDMFNREASMPEFTFSWGYSIYDPKADADLYSTCRRADKNMYMRKQQYYKNKNT
ncbi:GGDEF domain-containing protein [Enterocloster bolteae]|uniref:GGDEF domain-containing protein n=1 Tax=Enterocloster bolteae TaxID=208479 RepID=UPI00148C2FC7|nr:GGDEF domain-containing protein [Enterocloster bolteae]QJU21097.1 GGDEF domain-containing protein [Enterocloster bolteae]